jgi:hypothetical protein
MQYKLMIIFTNKVLLCDYIWVKEGAVIAQHEFVWMTTIMLHLSIQPTTLLRV